jgi:6-methylsalicylate decarboxylase
VVRLDTPPVNNWTPQKSLDDMNQGGVATAIVSQTLPAVAFLGAKVAAAVAHTSNEWTGSSQTITRVASACLPCCPRHIPTRR